MRDALPDDLARRVRALPCGRMFETKEGYIVVGQRPNAPVYAMIGLFALGAVVGGSVGHAARVGGAVAFAVWAVLELGWGVNPFRRLLGAAGLVFLVGILVLGARGVG